MTTTKHAMGISLFLSGVLALGMTTTDALLTRPTFISEHHGSSAFAQLKCSLHHSAALATGRKPSELHMASRQKRRGGHRQSHHQSQQRSKRQERVGQLVRTELASIIQRGYEIKHVDWLDDALRRNINVVKADVSPDLRQARVTVSIIGGTSANAENIQPHDATQVAAMKRKAYSWLVSSTAMIRHALAQRLKHMKTVPNLTFVRADVAAAVDVMDLIDRVSANSNEKRKTLGMYGGDDDELPSGVLMGIDFDGDVEEGEWLDDDDDEDVFLFDDDEEDDVEEEESDGKNQLEP